MTLGWALGPGWATSCRTRSIALRAESATRGVPGAGRHAAISHARTLIAHVAEYDR